MYKKNTSGSRLFLIEFLIVLFFFLIVSTICLNLFVHAHKITTDSENLSRAQTLAASAAELLLAGCDIDETISICQKQAENTYTGNAAGSDALCIQITEVSDSGSETNAHLKQYLINICQTSEEQILYQLPLSVHQM